MTKRARVTNTRMAGENHAVNTIVGGRGDIYRREPCAQCPWRKDAVGVFPAEAFKHSASTAYDAACNTFACHDSGSKNPALCAGFILRNSANNIAMRMKLHSGKVDPRQVSDGGVELFESYREMAVANGVDPNDPVLAPCRNDRGEYA